MNNKQKNNPLRSNKFYPLLSARNRWVHKTERLQVVISLTICKYIKKSNKYINKRFILLGERLSAKVLSQVKQSIKLIYRFKCYAKY